jgi:hypothetical protein
MSTEQQPSTPRSTEDTTVFGATTVDTAEWGAQQQKPRQPKQKRNVRKLAVALAVALGIAGAGAGVVYAASGSTTASDQNQGPGGGMGGGPGGAAGGLFDALHGEYVVSDGSGNYTTELMQTGEVTSVSATSITATSEDGYTHTYTIDSDTVVGNGSAELSSIATGDEVTIVASVSGDTATAESLVEAGTATGGGQVGQAPPAGGA